VGIQWVGEKSQPAPPPRARLASTVVYFLQGERTGLIKIGRAADLASRLRALQTGSPDKLRVIGVLPCASPLPHEKGLHEQFSALRQHGEWFSPGEPLLAYVTSRCLDYETYLNNLARSAQVMRGLVAA
jgi:hypothetical protein